MPTSRLAINGVVALWKHRQPPLNASTTLRHVSHAELVVFTRGHTAVSIPGLIRSAVSKWYHSTREKILITLTLHGAGSTFIPPTNGYQAPTYADPAAAAVVAKGLARA